MALKYTPDELTYLRDSPLCVKPSGLPPAEQWMGAPSDTNRNTSTRLPVDRTKDHDANPLLDHNRRPRPEKHISRTSANPEDIVLGPPKTAFISSRNAKTIDSPDRPTLRDNDSKDRFSFRGKAGDGDDRPRRDTLRPRRGDGDDGEGWSTVKPRKSFGTEGAERFNGRMGGERHRDDRRFKDREDRDLKERPRGFDNFMRDKDNDQDQDNSRRNGNARGRNEPSWFKDNNDDPPTPRDRNGNGDRFTDRSRGWREKDPDDRGDRDKGDRRWDRDRENRQDHKPEWMDEPQPVEEKGQIHTQEDFQKWKEQMAGKDKTTVSKPPVEEAGSRKPDELPSFFGPPKPKLVAPLPIDTGPDKFFGMWATPKDEGGLTPASELSKEATSKSATTTMKSSRFTSFFTQDDSARKPEPQTAIPGPSNGFQSLFSNNSTSDSPSEKEAFQLILQKLQRQSMGSTPPANPMMQPKPPQEKQPATPFEGPEPFQQYRPERQDEVRMASRSQPQNLQDLLNQRQSSGSQPTVRPEQMLQDLVGQRQNAYSQSSNRPDQPQRAASNTEFLMNLMQSAKAAPEPQRTEQVLLGLPPKQQMNRQMEQQLLEREQLQREAAAQRERSASQRGPPGFFDDGSGQFRPGGPPQRPSQHDLSKFRDNPPQPTQILQRPPPPGLDQGWPGQPPPPQQLRHIAPPPGLAGGAPRGMPMPQQMFPPGFPMAAMNNFPPPEAMGGHPRNMQLPPGYFNAPPPGFPPPGMSPFSTGPEGMAFPFDGRGGPPPSQGAYRRQ